MGEKKYPNGNDSSYLRLELLICQRKSMKGETTLRLMGKGQVECTKFPGDNPFFRSIKKNQSAVSSFIPC